MIELRKKLEQLLSINIDLTNREVLIFGAGNTSYLYERCFEIEHIKPNYFVDNDPAKHNRTFCGGITVCSLDEALEKCTNPLFLVCSGQTRVIKILNTLLDQKKLEHYLVDSYVFSKHKNDILSIFDDLQSETSKKLWYHIIWARMTGNEINENYVTANQYFAIKQFLYRSENEVFVDCGAYVGDSLEAYLKTKEGIFNKYYAFEPNQRNFDALAHRTSRLRQEWALSEDRIILIQAGVGKENSKMTTRNTDETKAALGFAFSENGDGDVCKIVCLDDYFSTQKISCIKADIESFEDLLLDGAEKIIKRDSPLISICIYHNPTDMYQIWKHIKRLNPNYKFEIRHHYYEYSETVLYAYL